MGFLQRGYFGTNFLHGGIQHIYKFHNNYGASVIQHQFSYGYEDDLWELGVTKWNLDGDWHLDYTTPVTDDVEGRLTVEDVNNLLRQIEQLPEAVYEAK